MPVNRSACGDSASSRSGSSPEADRLAERASTGWARVTIGLWLAPRADRSPKPQRRCRPEGGRSPFTRSYTATLATAPTPSSTSPPARGTCTTFTWRSSATTGSGGPGAAPRPAGHLHRSRAEPASHPGGPRSPPSVAVCAHRRLRDKVPEIYAKSLGGIRDGSSRSTSATSDATRAMVGWRMSHTHGPTTCPSCSRPTPTRTPARGRARSREPSAARVGRALGRTWR
jgi:hypothetical protein